MPPPEPAPVPDAVLPGSVRAEQAGMIWGVSFLGVLRFPEERNTFLADVQNVLTAEAARAKGTAGRAGPAKGTAGRAGPGCGLLGAARAEQAGLIWGVSFLGVPQEIEIYGEERARTGCGADAAYDIAVPVGLQVQRPASGGVAVEFHGEVVRSDDQRQRACAINLW